MNPIPYRRQCLWLSLVCLWLMVNTVYAQEYPVSPYISKANQIDPLLPWPKQSFYLQSWRGYMETVPATQFLSGIGINYNLPSDANDSRVMDVLKEAGFTNARCEIGFGSMKWDETGLTNATRVRTVFQQLKLHGIRPLILLNAHHGQPCPVQGLAKKGAQVAGVGATEIYLKNNNGSFDMSDIVPGRTMIQTFTTSHMAGPLIVSADSSTGRCVLSRPLTTHDGMTEQVAVDQTINLLKLKYLPLYSVGSPEFEETAGGWMTYVETICTMLSEEGITDFDFEIWNELTFGSNFLSIQNYYDPDLPITVPCPICPGGGGYELARRTTDYLKSSYPNARVIWGFSNTTFYHTPIASLPSGTDGQSYHPYGTGKGTIPPSYIPGSRDLWYIEGWGPNGLTKCMPEGWAHIPLQCEALTHNILYPEKRLTTLPPNVSQFYHYFTEHGGTPQEAGIADQTQGLDYKAKMLVRALLFWLNKGLTKEYIYCAYGNNDVTGFGMLKASPAPRDYGSYSVEQLMSPALSSLRNVVRKFAGAQTLSAVRSLNVEVTATGTQTPIFSNVMQLDPSKPTPPPTPYYREMFTFLPFQVTPNKFVCGVYQMSYDVTNPPPAATYTVKVNNLNGQATTVAYYDPISDTAEPLQVIARDATSMTVRLTAVDYPRLLTLEEQSTLVLWDVDFNQDTVSSAPSTATYVPGTIGLQPQSLTTDAGNTVTVVSASGSLADKPALISRNGVGTYRPAITCDGGSNLVTSGLVRLEWDSMMTGWTIGPGGHSTENLLSQNITSSTGAMVLSIDYTRTGATGGTLGVQLANGADTTYTWAFNTPYHYLVELDLDKQTYSITITNLATSVATPIATNKVRTAGLTTFRGFFFRDSSALGGYDGSWTAVVDNLRIYRPLWNVNFNQDTVNNPPSTAVYTWGTPSLHPQTLTIDAGNTATVVSASGSLADKPVVLARNGTGTYRPTISCDGGVSLVTSGHVKLEWDSMMTSWTIGPNGRTTENLLSQNIVGTGSQAYLLSIAYTRTGTTGGTIAVQWANGVDSTYNWTFNTPYHYLVDLDLDRQTYSITITNLATGVATPIATNKVRTAGLTTFRGFYFRDSSAIGGYDGSWTAVVDNLKIYP